MQLACQHLFLLSPAPITCQAASQPQRSWLRHIICHHFFPPHPSCISSAVHQTVLFHYMSSQQHADLHVHLNGYTEHALKIQLWGRKCVNRPGLTSEDSGGKYFLLWCWFLRYRTGWCSVRTFRLWGTITCPWKEILWELLWLFPLYF